MEHSEGMAAMSDNSQSGRETLAPSYGDGGGQWENSRSVFSVPTHGLTSPRKKICRSIYEDLHEAADSHQTNAVCYFIAASKGPIKIGVSADVTRRLRDLQAGSPFLLKVLAVVSGGAMRERAYHLQFAHLRLHNEWFGRGLELTDEIKFRATLADRIRRQEIADAQAIEDEAEYLRIQAAITPRKEPK